MGRESLEIVLAAFFILGLVKFVKRGGLFENLIFYVYNAYIWIVIFIIIAVKKT